MSRQGWYGVDLDGTLAEYHGFQGINHIGKPIPKMLERVKQWLRQGKTVKIVTARVAQSVYRQRSEDIFRTIQAIKDWCVEHLGQELEVTCIKDYQMIELWDDRAVQVIENTGERADGPENGPFCIVSDNDGHNYVIMEKCRSAWDNIMRAGGEDVPDWAQRIDGVSSVVFNKFTIDEGKPYVSDADIDEDCR